MPALPDVPQVLRVEFAHTLGDDPHLTSRSYWKYTGGAPSNADCASFAGDASALWTANIAAITGTAVHLVEVIVTDLTSPTASQGTWTGSSGGTRSGTGLSINDVVNLGFQIARRYRGGKPKMFGPWGVDADLADPQHWSSAFVTAVNDAWADFATGFLVSSGTTSISEQVNVSYYHGFASVQNPVTLRWRNIPTPRATAVTDAITGHAASTLVSSQRRRIRVT